MLPFSTAPVSREACAVSYRHGGEEIFCTVSDRPDVALCINRQTLVALEAAGRLGRPFWIDCVCIPLSGHTLGDAFGYMGALYSALWVYSQVNWIEPVDDYLSRGWIMQEFLLAHQILSADVERALLASIAALRDAGARILAVLHAVLRADEAELAALAAALDALLRDLLLLLASRSVKILEYLTNDVHSFWLLQMTALNALLQRQVAGPTRGGSPAELAARHENGKLCACLPRIFFLDATLVVSVMKLQSPTTDILGRLENAFFTADLSVESDRLVAIFGVYNFLSRSEIRGPVFSGVWPSLRGTRVRAKRVASGFADAGLRLRGFPVHGLTVAPVVFEEIKDDPAAPDNYRVVLFVTNQAGDMVGLWTFSQLASPEPAVVFAGAAVFATEIDGLLEIPEGSIGALFARIVAEGRALATDRVDMPPSSRYRYYTSYGDSDMHLR